MARKVSGLSRNGPLQVRLSASPTLNLLCMGFKMFVSLQLASRGLFSFAFARLTNAKQNRPLLTGNFAVNLKFKVDCTSCKLNKKRNLPLKDGQECFLSYH